MICKLLATLDFLEKNVLLPEQFFSLFQKRGFFILDNAPFRDILKR
jgi:hypothetical protein